jgi:spore photoproduct lyase
MFDRIYIEESVQNEALTQELLERFSDADQIQCQRYTEIFNKKAQNFRLQKKNPALILARKFENFVLPAQEGFGIGAEENYYFSHMLNCLYDCRYCFLQGMYSSANYVLFVNYEDFLTAITDKIEALKGQEVHFFSGYDCDSLALEPVSHFATSFLPLFKEQSHALIELRTKSTQIRSLLDIEAFDNCVVAFSLTPGSIAEALEHKAPTVEKRIEAMLRLQEHGWQIGLRFDPLIYHTDFTDSYAELFDSVFTRLNINLIHSVSVGDFRLPKSFFKRLLRMYPDEKLFAAPIEEIGDLVTYKASLHDELFGQCSQMILEHIPAEKFYPSNNIL